MDCPIKCKYGPSKILQSLPRKARYAFILDHHYGVDDVLSYRLNEDLLNYFGQINLKDSDVYITSLSKCKKPPTRGCLNFINNELKVVNPEKILIFGNEAAAIMGITGSVSDNRIKFHDLVQDDLFSKLKIPTLVTNTIDAIYTLKRHTILDAINLLINGKEEFFDAKDITDPDELYNTLKSVQRWAFDFETTKDGKPFSMAIATEHENFYVEFDHIPLQAFKNIFLLENKKIIHSQYELSVLTNAGLPYDMNFADTWLYAYVVDPNRDSYSLKNLAADYFLRLDYSVDFDTYTSLSFQERKNYNVLDAVYTLKLYNKFQLESDRVKNLFKYIVNPFMFILHDMNHFGVKIDESGLSNILSTLRTNLEVLRNNLLSFKNVPKDLNISSPKQLRELLYDAWRLKPMQFTKNRQPSTDHEALLELASKYKRKEKVLTALADYSAVSGIYDLLKQFEEVKKEGRVYSKYWPNSTSTGRLASEHPNMQNIPQEYRWFIIPEHGIFFDADVSQSDIRMLAQESGDEVLIKKLEGDIHLAIAAIRFGKPESEVTPEERRSSKSITFGLIYGITEFGLARNLAISLEEASELKSRLLRELGGVERYWANTRKFLFEHLYVQSMFGRRRYFTKQQLTIDREATVRAALNAPIQGDTNDVIFLITSIMKKVMTRKNMFNRAAIQVHDEIVFEVDGPIDSILEEVSATFIKILGCLGIKMKLPIILEFGYGQRFGQIKKDNVWKIMPDGSFYLEKKMEEKNEQRLNNIGSAINQVSGTIEGDKAVLY